MVIYRMLEKLHLVHLFGDGAIAYIFTAFMIICESVIFSLCAKWFLNKFSVFLNKMLNYRRVRNV